MQKFRKKRALTLLEIMIAIFLITLITGAIGYNMRGALDKGKVFRTKQAIQQLNDLLTICLTEGTRNADEIAANPAQALKESGLAKNPDGLIQDGWGQPFKIYVARDRQSFRIRSEGLENYDRKHRQVVTQTDQSVDEDQAP